MLPATNMAGPGPFAAPRILLGYLLLLSADLPCLVHAETVYTPYTFVTLAGAVQQYTNVYLAPEGSFPQEIQVPIPGYRDGTGTNAVFFGPYGVAVDSFGNAYVADSENSLVRRVTADGTVTTLAGAPQYLGSADGIGTNAAFSFPVGLAVDGADTVYASDTFNSLIRKLTPVGLEWVVTTIAGGGPGVERWGHADGIGTNASFFHPAGIVVSSQGILYVSDADNNTIRELTPVGADWEVTTIAGTPTQIPTNGGFHLAGGYADGNGKQALLNGPLGLAIDKEDNLYVADSGNHVIRKLARHPPVRSLRRETSAGRGNDPSEHAAGNWLVSTLAGAPGEPGAADGPGRSARFNRPYGLAADSAGNLYVGDLGNFTVRKITPVGGRWAVTTVAGVPGLAGGADGTGAGALFGRTNVWFGGSAGPAGVAVDGIGNLYVTDPLNSTIRKGWPASQY